jgi:uncharacterized protein YecE (DUF72 family)
MSAPIRIGTSGWSYPTGAGTWNGLFYPARRPRGFDELAYYAEHFDTVEVNSTFYRVPEPDLSRSWLRRTPREFLFSVKLFQKFTHPDMYLQRGEAKDWDLTEADVDLFRLGVAPLAEAGRLAAVLIQFPTSFHADSDTEGYLDWLLDAFREYPLAVELRHETWKRGGGAATADRLARGGAAWAIVDAPFGLGMDPQAAVARAAHGGLTYIRLHGRNAATWWQHEHRDDRYDYLYTADELRPFAAAARAASATSRRVLAYMNNHFSAKAVANAAILKSQLGQPLPGSYPPALVERYPELDGLVATTGLRL